MILARQITASLALLLILALAGILNVSLTQARLSLLQQVHDQAQQIAQVIGLALTPALREQQMPLAQKIITEANLLKTRYQVTAILEKTGEQIQAPLPMITQVVPGWFQYWQRIEVRPAEYAITAAWSVLAWVYVKPEVAVLEGLLWQYFLNMSTWLAITGVALFIMMFMIVRWLLAPLKPIATQALAIQHKEWGATIPLPANRELQQIARTLNDLSGILKRSLDEQVKLAERLRMERDQDEVTQLGNRRYFEQTLKRLLATPDYFLSGAVCLLELAHFKDYNDKMGYAAGDDLLRRMAAFLMEVSQSAGEVTLARLGGGHFGILLQDVSCEDAEVFAAYICDKIKQLYADGLVESLQTGHLGMACFIGKHHPAELLAQADAALRLAQRKGATGWYRYAMGETAAPTTPYTAREWLNILRNAITRKEILLFYQPVVSITDYQSCYHEVYARIQQEQQTIPAYLFVPLAERNGIIQELDQLIVTAVLALPRQPSPPTLGLNFSIQSLCHEEFVAWLLQILRANPQWARQLVFEIPEHNIVQHFVKLSQFSKAVRSLGCRIALDHFGGHLHSFSYLSQLQPDYIKLDSSFTQNLQENLSYQFFLKSLINIAHHLDIQVIAQRVELEEERQALQQLQVDAIQGYLTGEPRRTY